MVEASLGLIANITHEPTQLLREFGLSICKQCLAICKKHKHYKLMVSRGLTLSSHILPNCIPAVDWWCDNGGMDVLLYTLKVHCDCVCYCIQHLICPVLFSPSRQFSNIILSRKFNWPRFKFSLKGEGEKGENKMGAKFSLYTVAYTDFIKDFYISWIKS